MSYNKRLVTSIILSLTILALGVAYSAPKIDALATVSGVKGEVQVQKGGAGEWKEAKDGMLLREGDIIKTSADSSCVLKWSQGNAVKMTPFTNLKIERLEINPSAGAENSSLGMWTGKVYGQVKKMTNSASTFEFKTPTAIAGVRGTKLAVGVGEDETTSVECFEGTVVVQGAAGGEITLNDGQMTTVKKNEQPAPPEEIEQEVMSEFEAVEELSDVTLEIIQPIGNLESDITPITVKGKTAPNTAVTVNGQPATADDSGIFTASVDLTEGVNHIKIEAANKQGKVTTKTRVVKYMPSPEKPPETGSISLTVISPTSGYITREDTVTVSGTVSPGTEVFINDAPTGKPEGATSFTGTVSLVEGENLITVIAKRGVLEKSVTLTVIKDTMPPILNIIQPQANFRVGSGACVLVGSEIECTVIGQTEPGAVLTINGIQYRVESDGTFTHTITIGYEESCINIAAEDSVKNRTAVVICRTIDTGEVSYLEVSVSPAQIVADSVSTATITVRADNFLREPVDGAQVSLMATSGGSLSATTLTTVNGTATAVFTAGTGSIPNTVTITASVTTTAGTITASTTLLLAPDVPPTH
ncbi:MAG: FecR domain-containing protein [bacterium]